MEFDNVPQESLKTNGDLMIAYMDSKGIDASPGTALNELVVQPGALLFTKAEDSFEKALNNLDLNTASDMYAERLLSNYGLFTQSAGPGEGFVLLLTDSDEDFVVRQDTIFSTGDYAILLGRDYIGTVDYNSQSPDVYVPLKKYNNELYYIMVEGFTSTDMTTPLLAGTELSGGESITGLFSASVATSFRSTTTPRTLDDLKEEVTNGVSAKILAGPDHIKALLEESNQLPVIDTSVVGMNDIEMLRDSKNIYGTSSGGYVDIYVKTSQLPDIIEVEKPATRVSEGRYRVLIDKDDAPGFYYVRSVVYGTQTKSSDMSMFNYTFGVDTSDEIFIPGFPETRDGRYSSYQNCAVEFDYEAVPEDDVSPVFTVEMVYMPSIRAVQDFVSDPATRAPAVDYVVKAAVPLFMSVDLNVSYNPADNIPDAEKVASAVANVVNSIPEGQRFLSGASISCAVNDIYPDAVVKLPVTMEAFFVDNVGAFHSIRSDSTLRIPDLAEIGVTNKTATFALNPRDVGVRLTGDKK